ncbi:MAG: HYR domain-containing protein [Flavobacteriaceae bacterium]|nr:HYR domain-containing protein [Flavobacteriaceae bacterium]
MKSKLLRGLFVSLMLISFTKTKAQTYCTPSFSRSAGYMGIKKVTLNTINNSSLNNGYTFYSNTSTNLTPGNTYNINVTSSVPFSRRGHLKAQYLTVWIDYNSNGVFENNEKIVNNTYLYRPVSRNFIVPSNVIGGLTRMRVKTRWVRRGKVNDPCQTVGYGETEDYVINFTQPIVVKTKPFTALLDATGNVSIQASDINNGSTGLGLTLSLDAGQGHFTCANIGPNTVTLAVTDGNNNTATGTAVVTVVDNLGPTVLTKNIVLDLDAVGAATILPQDIDNGSSDNCAIASMSILPNAFTCANMGDNTVTLTVTDVNGNISTNTAVVTIVDNISPVVTTQNVTVYLDANGTASVTAAQVENGSTDNCSIASYSLSLPRGGTIDVTNISCADVGVHNVTLNVTDPSGNTGSGTAQITVVDNIAPVISCPTDINAIATSAAGALVNYTTPVGTDNCTATTTLTAGLASGATFPIGTTVVTHVVTDASGLTATCSFNVTVVGVPPVIVCPADITVSNDPGLCGATVSYAATETVGIPASTITYTIAPGSSFAVGTTAVTATATNAVGSSTCTFNVTVNDTEAPVVNVHPFTTTITNGVATVTPTDVDNFSTDNCGIASMSVSPNTFVCGDQGNHVVTLTVTDIHGLTASQTTTVTVVGDVPVISINTFMAVPTQNTNTIYLGYGPQSMGLTTTTTGGTGFTYNWTSSTGEIVASVANPTISPLVSTTYTVTVTNANGCSATATTDVCVIDARAIGEDGEYEGKVLVCKGSDNDGDHDKEHSSSKDGDDDGHGQKAKTVKKKDVAEYLEEGGTLGGCNATCTTTYVNVIVENNNDDHADNDNDNDDNDHSDNKDDKKDKDKSGRSNARTIIYPNPAVDEVVVSLDKKGEGTIEVYDYSGRIIFKKKVKNLKEGIKLNMRSKMSGSYFTRIIYKGKVYTAIIFKKK